MEWIKLIADLGTVAVIVVSGKYIIDKVFNQVVNPLMDLIKKILEKGSDIDG